VTPARAAPLRCSGVITQHSRRGLRCLSVGRAVIDQLDEAGGKRCVRYQAQWLNAREVGEEGTACSGRDGVDVEAVLVDNAQLRAIEPRTARLIFVRRPAGLVPLALRLDAHAHAPGLLGPQLVASRIATSLV
jgi:hypothetical protein